MLSVLSRSLVSPPIAFRGIAPDFHLPALGPLMMKLQAVSVETQKGVWRRHL
jgi:hypothetical protein